MKVNSHRHHRHHNQHHHCHRHHHHHQHHHCHHRHHLSTQRHYHYRSLATEATITAVCHYHHLSCSSIIVVERISTFNSVLVMDEMLCSNIIQNKKLVLSVFKCETSSVRRRVSISVCASNNAK
uniref:Uncharacterized protein n=1 Tax=Glossina brevipalpis TaxID=37001 RepID=A0A1A9X3S1_9MUSC